MRVHGITSGMCVMVSYSTVFILTQFFMQTAVNFLSLWSIKQAMKMKIINVNYIFIGLGKIIVLLHNMSQAVLPSIVKRI